MNSKEEAEYRLKLAEGYLEEAERLFELEFWRACAGSCQLAVENSSKAIIALYRPVVKSHDLQEILLSLLEEHELRGNKALSVERLAEHAKILGLKEHILTDYGDELTYTTPWNIYTQQHATKALEIAREAVKITEEFIKER